MAWINTDEIKEEERPAGGDFTPIPEGDYDVVIAKIDDKTTAKGGKMLATGFQVVSGEYTNRWVWRIHVKIKRNDYMDRLENVLSWVVEGKGKVNPTAVARVEPDSINKDDSIPF